MSLLHLRQTHTFVTLPLTQRAYNEIKRKLKIAKYEHCFLEDGAIDMQGIAVIPPKKRSKK